MASITPGGNSVKKFGRKLSHSTLRRLVMTAVTSVPAMSQVRRSPRFRPSDLAMPSSIDSPPEGSRQCVPPLAGDDAVGRRQLGHPGKIELALGEPPLARLGEAGGIERRAVHRDQTTAHHRIERHVASGSALEQRTHALDLVGQDIEDELVGCIGRQARPPVLHEIAAHRGEQQQRHQAEGERADLQARGQRPATQIGEPEAPGHAALRAGASAPPAAAMPPRPRRRRSPPMPPTMIAGGPGILRLPGDEQRDHAGAEHVG